ncbi:hypothetical protein JZ751_008002 [Albula glossodonta]|uniref:Uncharacterized protein n=1 Tax=Albula glossodonta TaxID=121402 RepID=A0A8T2P1H9_9TELE|nr:hypothetical protein JZ751_008002 [Albula glossodonta]
MDFVQKIAGSKADDIIDQTAEVVKDKLGNLIGGEKEEKKEEGGIGGVLNNIAEKAVADAAADKAQDTVMGVAKSLFG